MSAQAWHRVPCDTGSCAEVRYVDHGRAVEVRSTRLDAVGSITLTREEWDALVGGIAELDRLLRWGA